MPSRVSRYGLASSIAQLEVFESTPSNTQPAETWKSDGASRNWTIATGAAALSAREGASTPCGGQEATAARAAQQGRRGLT